jgi:uncharacterized protein YndB with AHSA1/START domain
MGKRIVSASRVINASPDKIFAVLADPSKHPLIDGSGMVVSSKSNPDRLSLGASFSMNMKLGAKYTTKNVVSEFEENHVIAWHHHAQFVWRYQLDPVEGGTKVTESFDYSKPWGVFLIPAGTPAKNQRAMEKTLERLDKLVTTGSAD